MIKMVVTATVCLGISMQASAVVVIKVANPGFDFITNGDGLGNNSVAGEINPKDSFLSKASDPLVPTSYFFNDMARNGTATLLDWILVDNKIAKSGVQCLSDGYYRGNKPTGATAVMFSGEVFEQVILGVLCPETTYTLSVEVYARADIATLPALDSFDLKLKDRSGNILPGTVTAEPFYNGSTKAILTVVTDSNQGFGDLIVCIGSKSAVQLNYDNVVLEADGVGEIFVPEPAYAVLVGLGCLAIVFRKYKIDASE